jgi:Asp-tRNA(Asn)/Glu-tRNA(Gln) amidotransferase C subunit
MCASLYQKMALTQEQIKRLKKLSALSGEKTLEIWSVLESFSLLEKTVTNEQKQPVRSGNNLLITREDTVKESTLQDKLLGATKQKVMAHQIVLGGIMHGE